VKNVIHYCPTKIKKNKVLIKFRKTIKLDDSVKWFKEIPIILEKYEHLFDKYDISISKDMYKEFKWMFNNRIASINI
jgi:hypothetical protein